MTAKALTQKKQTVADDGHTHIGIQNVKSRLQQMADGSLSIESVPGKGTTATVRLVRNAAETEV